jgi:PEP-CTERM motif-containing protein
MRKSLAPLLCAVVALMVAQAGATVVTSIPGGNITPMPAVNYFGGGPQTFGNATWSSTNLVNQGGSVFGYTVGYGFGGDGSWTGALGAMAGLNDNTDFYGATDTMTFAFATQVSAVGGFLNYYLGGSTPTMIAVYGASWNLIESYTLTFSTGGGNDTGAFYGFQESGRTIKYFTLTDNYVGITGLTTVAPEPSTLLLIGTGLIGTVGYGRRRLGR